MTEAALLTGKPPEVQAAFHKLRGAVAAFGDVHVDAVKASVNFGAKSHFAAAWPRSGRLDVEFVLDRPLRSRRVSKLQSLTATKHVHWVQVAGPEEVDAELLAWLRKSYALRSTAPPGTASRPRSPPRTA
ncbi:MAG TPA: DUF5655 domain-containing protein [Myxococcales bacterium]|nr:DUF5655 domain-containing protein [Myxococcales bacterium]